MYAIELLPRAIRELKKLTSQVQADVIKQLEGLKNTPYPDGWKKLQGVPGKVLKTLDCAALYHVRCDKYRIVYAVKEEISRWSWLKSAPEREYIVFWSLNKLNHHKKGKGSLPAFWRPPFTCSRTPFIPGVQISLSYVLKYNKTPLKRGFKIGGEREIRTPGGLAPTTVFKTAALNRSAISPYPYTLFYNII